MKLKKMLIIFLALLCVLSTLTACEKEAKLYNITKLSDLNKENVVVSQPSDYNLQGGIADYCPKAQLEYIDSMQLALSSLKSGKVDAFFVGRSYYDAAVEAGMTEGLTALDEPIYTFYLGLALNEKAPVENYVDRVNEALAEIQNDGVLLDMQKRWFEEGAEALPEFPVIENPEATLKLVTFGQSKPYSFYSGEKLVGFDVELACRVAAMLNCNVTIESAEYPAMLMGVSTGKYDMVSANMYITDDRAENVTFSNAFDSMEICAIVRIAEEGAGTESPWTTLVNSFKKTFINDNRWKLLLSGFETTLIITFFGFILANLLGAGYCALAMSKDSWKRNTAKVYSRIMQGTPLVVVLLILFFVIFGNTNVSGAFVAIIAFGLDSGVALGQLFYGGVSAVPKGQKEAALALGFTKFQTFKAIVLPQTIRTVVPGYFSTLIGLMKGTSIVGYVTVVDLTKAGNIIQSNTFEAFFPLISVALVYFLISTLLLSIAQSIQKDLEPKRVAEKEAE